MMGGQRSRQRGFNAASNWETTAATSSGGTVSRLTRPKQMSFKREQHLRLAARLHEQFYLGGGPSGPYGYREGHCRDHHDIALPTGSGAFCCKNQTGQKK